MRDRCKPKRIVPRIVSFGEVLFDVFPDGARPGGAPLNLAVRLHRLGAEVSLISAVGNDVLGRRALACIREQGLSAAGVSVVPYPTGTVTVSLSAEKIPSYVFQTDSAYDHIPDPGATALPCEPDLFCFGTLAQRGSDSRRTLYRLLDRHRGKVFCDVNLRQDFYSADLLCESLSAADLVKLNEDELPVLAELFGLPADNAALAARFQLETVILTLGPRGCRVWRNGESVISPALPVEVVSTVGAGDAFSAAFLYADLTGGTLLEAAEAGNRLAAEAAAQTGAF